MEYMYVCRLLGTENGIIFISARHILEKHVIVFLGTKLEEGIRQQLMQF